MKIPVPLVVIILCTVAGCTSEVQPGYDILSNDRTFTVKMQINSNSTGLEILSSAQGHDKWRKQKGWVGFEEAKDGAIIFSLEDEQVGDKCPSAVPAGTATWVITQIALSDEGNPDTQKGSNFGSYVDPWLADAFPDINAKGELDIPVPVAKTSVILFNRNNHPKKDGLKIAYYRVTATNCADPTKTLTADPGIGNKGK